MYKLIIAEIDTYMGDALVLLALKGVKKDQVAFLQLVAGDMATGFILFF